MNLGFNNQPKSDNSSKAANKKFAKDLSSKLKEVSLNEKEIQFYDRRISKQQLRKMKKALETTE